ncbi:MAG: electron transfer flavoprotein subunit alpha/FixB family protein [Anaerolineae bacterium]|nr:electron transfer flavoprotein subunit alpha/FixB family protein [Anaerolineae bacterium]
MDLDFLESMVGEAVEESPYRDIWVVVEKEGEALAPVVLEMLGQARQLSDSLGVYVKAVFPGESTEELRQKLVSNGADVVYVTDDPRLSEYNTEIYSKVLGDLIEEGKPEIVLLGATSMGRDLAPRLAQRLGTALFTNCLNLEIDEMQRQLLATYPVYGGEYFQTSVCPEARPQMATVLPGAFRPPLADPSRTGEVETIAVEIDDLEVRSKLLKVVSEEVRPEVPLDKAKIVVSGGRGMGDADSFALVEELAEVLGGQVGGSRGAVDEGWIDEEKRVGLGGTEIAPDLYVACGIAGAIQHYAGILDSKFVVVINRDPNATLFQLADVGIVGDVHEVLPALIKELKEAA